MKKVILIVDDTPELLRAFERAVRMMGYKVRMAGNGREALDDLVLQQADLVVTDYEMPLIKGDDLCRQIKNLYQLPVILMSGKVTVHAVATECGADAALSKPFSNSELQEKIHRLLGSNPGSSGW